MSRPFPARALAVALGLVLSSGAAQATISWNFNYVTPGVGFGDPVEGAAAASRAGSALRDL